MFLEEPLELNLLARLIVHVYKGQYTITTSAELHWSEASSQPSSSTPSDVEMINNDPR